MSAESVPGSRSILVVDDDASARLVTQTVLENAGFRVICATRADEALEQMRNFHPQCVLLDVVLPGQNGFEICRRMRREDGAANLPILMLTGLQDSGSVRMAYEAGATDFAEKGSNLAQLPFRIRSLLRARDTAEALRRSETRLQDAQAVAGVGHWEWTGDGHCRDVSPVVLEILGGTADGGSVSFVQFCDFVPDEDRSALMSAIEPALIDGGSYKLVHRIRRPDGSMRTVQHHGRASLDSGDGTLVVLSTLCDITGQSEAEERVRFLSQFDPATGLPNRQHLLTIAAANMPPGDAAEPIAAILVADLIGFDLIQSTWGSTVADQGLRIVATRCTAALRALMPHGIRADGTTDGSAFAIGRLSGHRLGIVIWNLPGVDGVADAARVIKACTSEDLDIEEHSLRASIAVGVALHPQDALDPQLLLQNAEAAAREAQSPESSGFQFYSKELNVRAARRIALESDLRRALERGEFVLHYQPRVRFVDGRVLGAEALIRWQQEDGRLVSPGEFLPLAEKTGLIVPIGEWALRQACRDAKAWGEALDVSVNVSALQLKSGALWSQVQSALLHSGLAADRLELEVTESGLVHDPRAVARTFAQIRDAGTRIALDDFGTGYSSLGYLRHLPVDVLKIDRSFVVGVAGGGGDRTLVKTILVLATGLDLTTVAEGIEGAEQWAALRSLGCDEAQGYLISRPVPYQAFVDWVRNWAPLSIDGMSAAPQSAA
jgi:diguanylate cyclase (GGDEF)-like protein/PAS domain S-box-containing protein